MAPPKKEVNEVLLKSLAGILCTDNEISAIMHISVDTLNRRYAALLKECRETGKASLRRQQYKLAMQGNCSMLIFLGKNYLGQSDKIDERIFETKKVSEKYTKEINEQLDTLMKEWNEAKRDKSKATTLAETPRSYGDVPQGEDGDARLPRGSGRSDGSS